MTCKTPRSSLDSGPVGSIEDALVSLKLSVGAKDPEQSRRLDKVLEVLRDVVSVPNFHIGGECQEQEAASWELFAEVYAGEVAAQARLCGGRPPSAAAKRQILADILVWAEVTQDHYDSGTQRFVTEPHDGDESFQRIGRALRAAKAKAQAGKAICGGGGVGARERGGGGGSGRGSESSGDSACSSETHG